MFILLAVSQLGFHRISLNVVCFPSLYPAFDNHKPIKYLLNDKMCGNSIND